MTQTVQPSEFLTIKAAFTIPTLQAVTTGVFVAGAIGGPLSLVDWRSAIAGAITGGAIASLFAWNVALDRWRRLVETTAGAEPEPTLQEQNSMSTRLEIVENQGQSIRWIDLPTNQEKLAILAAGVTAGASLAINSWTGRGRPFTRTEFETLRSELMQCGWAEDLGGNRGLQLTRPGRAVIEHFANLDDTTPLLTRD